MGDTVIETERLVLRKWREEDRAPFAAMNADPVVMRYFKSVLARAESDVLVDRISAHFEKHGFSLFALERKADGAFLGFTGMLTGPADTPVAEDVEIGWRLAREYWRQGFAFEAASACIDWFWHHSDFPRLVSFTSDQNRPSQNLMQKLGFERRPDLDFDHPHVDPDSNLLRHVTYCTKEPS